MMYRSLFGKIFSPFVGGQIASALIFAFLFSVKLFVVENLILTPTNHLGAAVLAKGVLLLLSSIVLFWMFSGSRALLIMFYCVSAIYIVAQIEYNDYFRSPLSMSGVADSLREAKKVMGLGVRLHLKSLLALMDIPCLLVLCIPRPKVSIRFTVPVGLAILVCIESAIGGWLWLSKATLSTSDYVILKRGGFVPWEIFSTYKQVFMRPHFHWGENRQFKRTLEHPNIVLIQVESMDSWMISNEWGGSPVMPNMRRLLSQAIYFPYMRSYHRGGGSSDADFMMEFSAPPFGERKALTAVNDFLNVLPNALGSVYDKAMVHGNDGAFWGRREAYSRCGFDTLVFLEQMKFTPVPGHWGVPDKITFDHALDWMQLRRKPFFCHIITISSHEPFTETRHLQADSTDYKPHSTEALFQSFSYVDNVLSEFILYAKAIPNTWIFVTGDHTPGNQAPSYNSPVIEAYGFRHELVPFIIFSPSNGCKRDSTTVLGFGDVAPTLLGLAGVGASFRTNGADALAENFDSKVIPDLDGGWFDRQTLRRIADSVANLRDTNRHAGARPLESR